ncbi:MAG: DUF4214 domain-containing protein, partial [Betaproteobacteria bacterium]|nr:DUF4214 domain-containing protein [Betaproteobacteria bacterium]
NASVDTAESKLDALVNDLLVGWDSCPVLTADCVHKAYLAFFNRPADVSGLNYWRDYPGYAVDLLTEFSKSAEYLSDFAGLDNSQIIAKVYQNLFARVPETDGLNYWADAMERGAVTIANVAYAVLEGAQGTDLHSVVNKLLASNMFTAALGTAEEIAAYGNADLIGLGNAAKEWLSAINSSNPSVHVAESKLGTLLHDLVGRWNDSGIDLVQIPGEVLDTNSVISAPDSLDFAALTARTGMNSLPDASPDALPPDVLLLDALQPDEAREPSQLIGYIDLPENSFTGYDAFVAANACLIG